jgi:hypothetical protein
MRRFLGGALLLCFVVLANVFAQTNATVGGTASDASGALIPGVTITATNTQTGIVTTTVSNETGTYQFPSLQTGVYKVSAELPGFQTQVYNDVTLGVAQQVRLNFSLQVGAAATTVDVSVAADTLLATSSSSVGTVLPEYKVRDLPLSSRDVLDLISLAPGVEGDNFAGHRTNQVATTRDGISVSDGRYDLGVFSQTYVSSDLVEEVRIVTSSADAELGRAGGVQMVTRAGTNQYRGSLFWTNHNSALSANTWDNNRTGVTPNYVNRNQFGGRLGGPLIKNKAFFFFLYDGQRTILKNVVTAPVLTAQARQGIFRYFPGVNNGNAASETTTGANPVAPVVDRLGSPTRPAAATGALESRSMYSRDPLRPALDPTGYIGGILAKSPLPNYFETGDGLNTAGYRFLRRIKGLDGASGDGVNINRDQVNIRLDYNFNSAHKLYLTMTRERVPSEGNNPPFPGSEFIGEVLRLPQVYTAAFTSTLSPTILNEFRFGFKRGKHLLRVPYSNSDPDIRDAVFKEISRGPGGYPWLANPVNFSHYWAWGLGDRDQWSAEKTFADSIAITRGAHAFKTGGEMRWSYNHSMQGANWVPTATMGAASFAPVTGIDSTSFPGILTTNQNRAMSILADLSGSITQVVQAFELDRASDTKFKDLFEQERKGKHRQIHQNNFNLFFKDDWKIHSDLTVNLGLRWDFFGVPYDAYGLMGTPVGGPASLHGLTGSSFTGQLTTIDTVGKNSTHPERTLWENDYNNFGPSLGFSWSVPYFGKGKTVVRGGYAVTYQGGGRTFSNLDGAVGSIQGLRWSSNNTTYGLPWRSLSDIAPPLPRGQILEPVTLTARNVTISAYETNYINPYVQNFNIELQRDLGTSMVLDLRYIGSKGTKLYSEVPLNQITLNRNPEFLDAIRVTQAGGDAPLFTRMLQGLNVPGFGVVDGITRTGSAAMRSSTNTRDALANNDAGTLANFINTTNAFTSPAVNGGILRNGGLPETYFVANPQFSAVSLNGNTGNSTYHSMVVELTKRLSHGFTNQTSYIWSRALGSDGDDDGTNYRDIYNQQLDKTLLSFHRTHGIRSNGTYQLPFGPNRSFLASAPGWVSRIVERWQVGAVGSWSSGAPLDVTASTASFSNSTANTPMIVADFPKSSGKVVPATDLPGARYLTNLVQVDDPFGRTLTTLQSFNTRFTNRAIQDTNGNFVLVNPGLGQLGTLGKRWIEGPGRYSLDMNLIKRVRIDETKEVEVRVDAINVLNHSTWGNPTLDINSTNFGRITTKTGNRTFTLNARLNF